MLWPILETAGAAVVASYLAKLLLGERETGFAPIAAVICLGAALGQQRERALELMGGVVLGVLSADLLVRVLGSGPPQVGRWPSEATRLAPLRSAGRPAERWTATWRSAGTSTSRCATSASWRATRCSCELPPGADKHPQSLRFRH
jgi:Fusaric acid resistance protein-like